MKISSQKATWLFLSFLILIIAALIFFARLKDVNVELLLTLLIPALITVAGWWFASWKQAQQDVANKKRELITQHLIRSYIRIAESTNRKFDKHPQKFLRLEFAFRDIMLFDSIEQANLVVQLANDIGEQFDPSKNKKSTSMDELLVSLRNDLRRELGLDPIDQPSIPTFRFSVSEETAIKYPEDNLEL